MTAKGEVEMVANLLINRVEEFPMQWYVYIVLLIVAVVLIGALLDGVRNMIKGLDTSLLGGLLVWIGYKVKDVPDAAGASTLIYVIGGTLIASGILVFILTRMYRHKRHVRIVQRAEQEREWEKIQQLEKEKAEAEAHVQALEQEKTQETTETKE